MLKLAAQTNKGGINLPDNRYDPYHQTIKDSAAKTVSKFGHYFSLGASPANAQLAKGHTIIAGYSFAYKSHLFSATVVDREKGDPSHSSKTLWNTTKYAAVLFGEAIRYKHFLISLSTGVTMSIFTGNDPKLIQSLPNHGYYKSTQPGIGVPIELKAFLLAYNNIGIGIHISQNLMTFTPGGTNGYFVGFSLVTGIWNKPMEQKQFAADSVFIYKNYIAKGTISNIKYICNYLDSTKAPKVKIDDSVVTQLKRSFTKIKQRSSVKQKNGGDGCYAVVYNKGRKNSYLIESSYDEGRLVNLTNMTKWTLNTIERRKQFYELLRKYWP